MSKLDQHTADYERLVRLPWDSSVGRPQRVWFGVYDPASERRLRCSLDDFAVVTKRHGHGWKVCDLTDVFPQWLSAQEYRDSYFESPDDLRLPLADFRTFAEDQVRKALCEPGVDDSTVVALCGVVSLFGMVRVSELLEQVVSHVQGRLAVFFPGEHEGSTYRFLGARDGWNYLAVPFTIRFGGASA